MSDIASFLLGLAGLLVALGGLILAMSRQQEQRFEKYLNAKFEDQNKQLLGQEGRHDKSDRRVTEIERDVMQLRSELPEKYLRREDYVRGQTVLESKMDSLALRIENLQLKGLPQ